MQKKIVKFIGYALMALAFIALLNWIVMLLWNGVLADVTPVSKITYWQSLGLLALAKLLFGSWQHKGHEKKQHWKMKMAQRMGNMSDEERAKMKEEWHKCCSRWSPPKNQQEPAE